VEDGAGEAEADHGMDWLQDMRLEGRERINRRSPMPDAQPTGGHGSGGAGRNLFREARQGEAGGPGLAPSLQGVGPPVRGRGPPRISSPPPPRRPPAGCAEGPDDRETEIFVGDAAAIPGSESFVVTWPFPRPQGSDTIPISCRPAVQFTPFYPAGPFPGSQPCSVTGPPDKSLFVLGGALSVEAKL
jgi:hypothetical protein